MHYTTYLFDFDYTLADSSRGIVLCFRNVLERNGYTDVTDDAIRRTIGKTLEESFSLLTGVADPERLADFKQQYRREADVHMTANTRLFPETLRVLRTLKERGAKVGIISTKYRFRIHDTMDRHLPADFLDIVVGGEDVSRAKPDPEGLLHAIGQLGVAKADVLYIGDSTVDAETAQAAGVDFAGVTHGVTTADELAAYPHRRIMASLDELVAEEGKKPQPPTRRRIAVRQIILLFLLGWLGWEEVFPLEDGPTFIFPTLFLVYLLKVGSTRRLLPTAAATWLKEHLRPVLVRARAFHILQIRGKRPAPLSTETCTCRNCGHTYTGNFCPRCGQTRGVYRFRLKHAPGNILRSLFRVDGKFGHTLVALLYRPGHLIRGFMQGRRAAYSMPLQTLFLLVAFYLLAVQLVIPKVQEERTEASEPDSVKIENLRQTIAEMQEERAEQPDSVSKISYDLGIAILQTRLNDLQPPSPAASGQQKKEEDSFVIEGEDFAVSENDLADAGNDLADAIAGGGSKLSRRLENAINGIPLLGRVWSLLKRWGHGNRTLYVIAILPLFAIGTYWSFQNRWRLRRRPAQVCFNPMEHFFIQAYIASQIMLVSILVLPFGLADSDSTIYALPGWLIFLLFWWDLRQLYLCTWWDSFKRTLLMFVYAFLLLTGIAMFVLILIAIAESLL